MATKAKPGFSTRLSYGKELEQFAAPKAEATWTGSHHKHTQWLSDEVWDALGEYVDKAKASGDHERSKSSTTEEALRAFLGLEPA